MDNLLKILPDLAQGFLGLQTQMKGFQLQAGAAQMAAQGFRQAASATKAIAEYNIELDRQRLMKQQDLYSRQVRNMMASQKVAMATTGFAQTSKSFLATANASLDIAARNVQSMRDAQKLQATQRRFEADVAAVDLQNRALAADYQAEVAQWRASNAQRAAIGSGITTVLGALF